MADKTLLEIVLGYTDAKLTSGLDRGRKNLNKFRLSVKKAFNTAVVKAFNVAVMAFNGTLAASVIEGARFNIQMARVWTMVPGGIKKFKELREQARGLAGDFGIARSEMAKGMYNALSAGIDKAGLEKFMKSAAKVAVADGSDISVAVDGITTVLNAFKIGSEETEKVTDDLFRTVAQGKTTFNELASSLSTVAPIAAASNIPLKQILAHVATLTAQGTPTAQAMTQIRASIMGMNKALGDGWAENMTYQDGLQETWELAGHSQTELLKMVGSTEAVQAVLGGVGENATLAKEKIQGMVNTAGAAQEAFEKVDQFRHWGRMLETSRGTLSKLGEYIDQRLQPYVDAVTEKIKEWRDDQGLWDKLGGFLDTADRKLRAIAGLVSQINSIEDVKFVAEVFGEWIKSKLLEGGQLIAQQILSVMPKVGGAIAKAAKEAVTPGGVDSMNAEQKQAARDASKKRTKGGRQYIDRGSYLVNKLMYEEKNRSERWESEGRGLAEGVSIPSLSIDELVAGMTKGVTEGVVAVSEAAGDAGPRLADLLKAGLSGKELEEAAAGMEMTAEELDKYIEALTGTADAAKKAGDQAVESNKGVQEALKQSGVAAQGTMDAAKKSVELSSAVISQNAQIVAQIGELKDELGRLDGLVRSAV